MAVTKALLAKTCSKCGVTKLLAEFYAHKNGKHGRQSSCKECDRTYSSAYHKDRPQENLKATKRWQANHPGAHNLRCASYTEKIKLEVFEHYGGACVHCGITDPDVLTIDHIAQNGAEHRKSMSGGRKNSMASWLRSNGYPEGFRLLCYNCNIKAFRIYQREQRSIKHGSC